MATCVMSVASISGFLHSVEIVVICILLTLAEFLAVALLVAPRAVSRKLLSLLRALCGLGGEPPVRRRPVTSQRVPHRKERDARAGHDHRLS